MMEKVLVVTAHDDDLIIGIGGILLLQHQADEIHHVICTACESSHRFVLGVTENPSPEEVRNIREVEYQESNGILSQHGLTITSEKWEYVDGFGEINNKTDEVEGRLYKLLEEIDPDVVYFHSLDSHEDHRAVSEGMARALNRFGFSGEAHVFDIWTEETSIESPEIARKEGQVGEAYAAERVDISEVLSIKRKAIKAFRSQLDSRPPYEGWAPQEKPILPDEFLKLFLNGIEIALRVR